MNRFFYLKYILILLIINGLSHRMVSQIGYQLVESANSMGMGGASIALQGVQAIYDNPAGLVGTTRSCALLATELKFGLKGLTPMSLAYVTPTQSSVFGFSFQNYTYDSFRENKLMVAYARRLTAKFNLGIHLDYLHLKVDEYGSKNLLTFGIGCNTWIFNNLVLSAYVYNPVSAKLNQDERTPSVFRLGLGYTINEKVLISVETEKNIYFAPSFKFGLSYQAAESLALRCGFRSSPNIFSFGLAYKINKNFTTDLALSNHAYLGMTPALSFNYSLGKEKGE